MEFLRNIRLRIGASILAKKISKLKRKVYYTNFQSVKKIGIVWDAGRISDFPGLSRFHQKMAEKKIEVKILGYFPGKVLPDQYTALSYLSVIRKEELNRYYLPDSREATQFMETPWDILLDLNFENNTPLRYITSLSKARFRVGLMDASASDLPFDLMMDLKKPVDMDKFLDQAVKYLEMIRNKEEKAAK